MKPSPIVRMTLAESTAYLERKYGLVVEATDPTTKSLMGFFAGGSLAKKKDAPAAASSPAAPHKGTSPAADPEEHAMHPAARAAAHAVRLSRDANDSHDALKKGEVSYDKASVVSQKHRRAHDANMEAAHHLAKNREYSNARDHIEQAKKHAHAELKVLLRVPHGKFSAVAPKTVEPAKTESVAAVRVSTLTEQRIKTGSLAKLLHELGRSHSL